MRKLLSVALVAVILSVAGCGRASQIAEHERAAEEYNSAHSYTGVATAEADTQAPKVVIVGDSYSAGAGAPASAKAWTQLTGAAKGWDVTNISSGGTGYVTSITSGGKAACGADYCSSYGERIDDIVAASPEMILLTGGRNDLLADPSLVEESAAELLRTLKSRLPGARVIVVNPQWDARMPPSEFDGITAAVGRAASSTGATFLDIGQPLSGQPQLISNDNVHPNESGHLGLASALEEALESEGI